jgi:hypothetical protein
MLRRLVSAIAVAVLAPIGCSGSAAAVAAHPTPSATTRQVPALNGCSADPTAHVYYPDRLRLLAACVTVTGIIDLVHAERDGDLHVRLRLDPGQTCDGQPCLSQENLTLQAGDLLLEPVCEHEATQADAVEACAGYHSPVVVPPVGSHVAATGPWVLDLNHGWNEIHPLEEIVLLPTGE